MNRVVKRLGIIFGLFFVALFVVVTILLSTFKDQIGQKIVGVINEQITSELTVHDFDISLLRSFPNVGVDLKDVQLNDTRGEILLATQTLSVRMGFFDLIRQNIAIKSILLSDGELNIAFDKRGRGNFDIAVESETTEEDSSTSNDLGVQLKYARLEKIKVQYVDSRAKQKVALTIEDAVVGGDLSAQAFQLNSNADILIDDIKLGRESYLAKKKITYDMDIAVDLENGKYAFDDAQIEVERNRFLINGIIEEKKEGQFFDLTIDGMRVDLASIISMLPKAQQGALEDIDSDGDFVFETTINGLYTTKLMPAIHVELGLENGSIQMDGMNRPLKEVSFIALYDNGSKKNNATSVVEIKEFEGEYGRENIQFDFKLNNLDDPRIDCKLNGKLPMDLVAGFADKEYISDSDGAIDIDHLVLKGRYKDMVSTSRIAKVELGGNVVFDNASLTINKEKVVLSSGPILLENNKLSIDNLTFVGAGTDLNFKGHAYNIIPVLFADSINSKHAELTFKADLTGESLDIDRLMALSPVSKEKVEEEKEVSIARKMNKQRVQSRERVTNFLQGSFEADLKNYNFNLLEGEDFKGKLVFNNNQLDVVGATHIMNGSIDVDGKVIFDDHPSLQLEMTTKAVSVSEFFRQTENFGQEVLTDKHLKGDLDAKMVIYGYWNELGEFLDDKLKVLAAIQLNDGELRGFSMLEDMSALVKVEDLRRIKFTRLSNYFELSKNRMILPVMFIQSNAMNLTIAGEHSFDNDIRYHIKVNAGQVIANRFKKHDPSFRPQKAQRDGFFNLYYSIRGNLDQFTYKPDKNNIKREFEISQLRRDNIQRELEEVFGEVDLIEEPAEWRDVVDYGNENDDNPDVDDESDFIDWDDEGR